EWIYSWIKNPKAMWPETKMPDLRLSDAEAMDITAYLVGLRSDQKYPEPKLSAGEQQKLAAQGKELIGKYGCFGCHNIKGFESERLVFWNGCRNCHVVEKRGGKIRDLYNDENLTFAPPVLTGEGAKVQPAWLFAFLKAPSPLRPWLSVRMPTFHFSDADATDVVHFFAAASNKSFPYLTAESQPLTGNRAKDADQLFKDL